MINVAIAVVKTYQSAKSKRIWILWLQELQSFSELPNFFKYFSQDYEKSKTIYKLIGRNLDIDSSMNSAQAEKLGKEYEKLCTEHVKYTYKIIDEVFQKHTDRSLRDQCIQNGTFTKFLDRLAQLTGEKKRTKRTAGLGDDLQIPEPVYNYSSSASSAQKKKEPGAASKKKGVGYTTGVGSAWNVQEYLESKEAKNHQIATIVSILMHSIQDKPEPEESAEPAIIPSQTPVEETKETVSAT